MICPKCGAEIDNDSKFCVKCGCALSESRRTPNNQIALNNQVAPNHVPEQQSNESQKSNEVKPKTNKGAFISGIIFIIVGIILCFESLGTHHGTYRGDWDNEVLGILWGIRYSLNILIMAMGVLIVAVAKKK